MTGKARHRRRATAAGLVLGAVASFMSANATNAADAAEAASEAVNGPVRILIVGDSMAMGSAGDWTWRYRLWQHFAGAGVAVDFVGPRTDMYDDVTGLLGSHAYVDPAFDQDHAARWGMSMTFPDDPIQELVADYQPDVVVEMLGVNDLAFLDETAAETAQVLRQFVADARSVDPTVDVVMGRIPQVWRDKVPEFNTRVDALAAELDSTGSRVVSAQADTGYVRAEDTWDGSHPNSHGDLKIAAAMADSLAAIGVGPVASRPLPDVPRGPRLRPVLTAKGDLYRADLGWLRSPGAQQAQVWVRDLTVGQAWHRVAEGITGTSYTATGLPGWHRVQLKVLPVKWNWAGADDAFSNVVEVEVTDNRLAAVRRVQALRTRSGAVRTAGLAVLGATSYRLVAARASSCARQPAPRRFKVIAAAASQPARRFRLDARAVWVRWVAARGALKGELARSSTDCVRLRR